MNIFARLRRRFLSNRRPFRLTRPGWVFILYTIGVGAGAINTGNNLLYLIFGVFLGLLMASGVLSDLSLWGVEVEWRFPRLVEAAAPAPLSVRLTNTKRWLPSVSVNVEMDAELRGRPVTLRGYVPVIRAGESVTCPLRFTPSARGWLDVKEVRFVTRYPFGLLKKWWSARLPERGLAPPADGAIVAPSPAAVAAEDLRGVLETADAAQEADERGEGGAVHGLRDFRHGDSPRRIHWKASVKRPVTNGDPSSAWLLREMQRDQAPGVLLEWPADAALAAMGEAERERFIGFAAGLAALLVSRGAPPTLLVPDGAVRCAVPWEGDGRAPLREFLALFEPGSAFLRPYLGEAAAPAVRGADLLKLFRRGARS